MQKQLTAVALLALVAGTAFAAPRESQSYPNPVNFFASAAPETFTMNFTGSDAGGAYQATHMLITGTLTSNIAATYASEATFDVTAPDGTTFTVQLSDQFTFTQVPVNVDAFIGAGVNPAGTWTFTAYDTYPDAGDPQSTLTDLVVTLDDTAPPSNLTPETATDLGSLSVGGQFGLDVMVPPASTLWYKFTTTADATNEAGHRLVVSTADSTNGGDTELGLFGSDGTLVSNNDDIFGLFSFIAHGANGYSAGGAPAGQYYVALSTYNAAFAGGFSVTSTGDGGNFHLDISLENAPYAPNSAIDLGTLVDGVTVTRDVEVPADGVVWYKAVCAEASMANFRSLTISTLNSPTVGDTMVAIYTEAGQGIVYADDSNGSPLSELVMGYEGFADLAAGTYYFPVMTYPSTLFINNFAIESTGPGGSFQLDVTQEVHPAPIMWDESTADGGDAGDNVANPAQVVAGSGPIERIIGSLGDTGDVDVFKITICDPSSFSADTAGTGFDTQLFLFDSNGMGVTSNDDSATGGSFLSSAFIPSAGDYYIAITGYNNDPTDNGGGLIWNNTPFGTERQPDGPSAANPLGGWTTANGFYTGAYQIDFTGTCFVGGASACSPADLGMAGGVVGQDRLLNNNDFIAFISLFFANDARADLGTAGGVAGSDNQWNNNDFIAFINFFFNDSAHCNG